MIKMPGEEKNESNDQRCKSNLLCGNAAVFIYFKVGGGVARGVAVYSGVIAYAVINAAAAGGRNSKA